MSQMEEADLKRDRDRVQRSRESPEVRRNSLIQATMRSIAKYGFAGSTIERICDEAQVSRGLINHHFQSKDELIRQAYKFLCEQWSFQTRSLISEESNPEDKLYSIIRSSFGPALFKPDYVGLWVGFGSVIAKTPSLRKLHHDLVVEDITTYQGLFEGIAKMRNKRINSRRATLSLMMMIDGFWNESYLDPDAFTADEAAQACMEFVDCVFR